MLLQNHQTYKNNKTPSGHPLTALTLTYYYASLINKNASKIFLSSSTRTQFTNSQYDRWEPSALRYSERL